MSRGTDIERVAEEAIFQLECGHEYIKMLAATFHVIHEQLKGQKGFEPLCDLASMGAFNADDWRNTLDGERESLEGRLASAQAEGAQCN